MALRVLALVRQDLLQVIGVGAQMTWLGGPGSHRGRLACFMIWSYLGRHRAPRAIVTATILFPLEGGEVTEARFRQIAADLRAKIKSGEYPVGSTIPHGDHLAAEYGVTLNTVRAAVAELRQEGLLKAVRRRGTVVRRPPVRVALSRYQRGNPDLGPWEAACADAGVDGRTEVKSVTRAKVDERIAELLEMRPGDEAVCRRRNHYADGDLAMTTEMWLRPDLVDDTPLSAAKKIIGGIYRAWVRLGWRPVRLSESVTVRPATPTEARAMQLPTGTQVLAIERVTQATEGTVLDVLRTVASPEWVTLVYEDVPIPMDGGGEPPRS